MRPTDSFSVTNCIIAPAESSCWTIKLSLMRALRTAMCCDCSRKSRQGLARFMSEEVLKIRLDDAAGAERFSRFGLIAWWDQRKLAQARVLVIGAGALGNEIVKNLALLGIGNLFIADKDRIENSNLSR